MIDSHCHLDFESIAENLDDIIINSKKNKLTSILSINTHPDKFNNHIKLISKYDGIYISYGLHPCNVNSMDQGSILDFDKYSSNPIVIGIGETGKDLYHTKNFLKEQIFIFEKHIEASLKHDLPLIIHQRNSEKEIIDILKNYLNLNIKVVFHCFTGSPNLVKFCLDNDFYISLSGIVTFNNADELRKSIKNFPLRLILIETDSPFLAPVPMRGKTNEPSYVKYIAEYLADYFDLELNQFIQIIDNNFFNLFNKSKRDNQL